MKAKVKKYIFPTVLIILSIGLISGFAYWRLVRSKTCDSILAKYNANTACILTNRGAMVFELYSDATPTAVKNFKTLSNDDKFYNGLEFYRVDKDFVVQGGIQDFRIQNLGIDKVSEDMQKRLSKFENNKFGVETNLNKLGLSSDEIKSLTESGINSNSSLNTRKFEYGSLSFANAGPDTNSTEIFIVTAKDQNSESMKFLQGRFSNMGKIIAGQKVLDNLNNSAINTAYEYVQQGSKSQKPKDIIKIIEVKVK